MVLDIRKSWLNRLDGRFSDIVRHDRRTPTPEQAHDS
jgi:hypothetical protein